MFGAPKGNDHGRGDGGRAGLLNESEFDLVTRSHYPTLAGATKPELIDLVRLLREQRSRSRSIVRHRRGVRRGKADPRFIAVRDPERRRRPPIGIGDAHLRWTCVHGRGRRGGFQGKAAGRGLLCKPW